MFKVVGLVITAVGVISSVFVVWAIATTDMGTGDSQRKYLAKGPVVPIRTDPAYGAAGGLRGYE